ncbi:GNAT family N-acetyltransferase [Longispora albida]|uniref:GNAT family N-acetyltransferase n=1 Tax=Longispora albida TaxID=203523 RepID=UPI000370295B|nr:GNAT family N-acetyltransferase [Longispora albida]
MGVMTIEMLADRPELIEAVGELRWREWGRPPEPADVGFWVEATRREAGRDALPVTFAATVDGVVAGAVGLGEYDPEELRDRSPWVLGTVVDPSLRGTGIGQALMSELEGWAARHGYERLWVATERAGRFYERCGWRAEERLGPAVILSKRLTGSSR